MSIFSNASANSKCGKMLTNGKARWKARMVKGCSLYCSCTFSIGLKCFNVKCGGNNKTTIKKQTKWCSMQTLYLVLPQAWAPSTPGADCSWDSGLGSLQAPIPALPWLRGKSEKLQNLEHWVWALLTLLPPWAGKALTRGPAMLV